MLLIISDDQAWNDYSFMGHDTIQTPNLDQLARESVTFTRGYVPTALCRPSLATIITGHYPRTHGITGNDPAIPSGLSGNPRRNADYLATCNRLIEKFGQSTTLPEHLESLGYRSLQTGKWWEGDPRDHGFTAAMTHGDPTRGGRHGDLGLKIGREGLAPIFDFIDEEPEQPFFVWYAPFLPHTPHNPPARLLDKYRADNRPIELSRYFAMCEWFDETCGELLAGLESRGLSENTLVVYVTDNGWIQRTPNTPNLPQGWTRSFAPRSKQTPNEGGVRTPVMVRWPARFGARMDEESLVSSIDLAPTILEACGLPIPNELPGLSLLDVCEGEPLNRQAIFGEGYAHDIADIDRPEASLLYRWCIAGPWKLHTYEDGQIGRYPRIHERESNSPQLYNLIRDPNEQLDQALRYLQVKQRMLPLIEEHWQQQ